MPPRPIQKAIVGLLDKLGYKANVDRDDHRLGEILGKEDARKVRGWCGGYLGANGKQHGGRVPRNADDVRDTFELLVQRAEPALQCELRQQLADVCRQFKAPAAPCSGAIVATENVECIVQTLASFLRLKRDQYEDARLDVVTRSAAHHKTFESCMGPMLDRMATMALAGDHIPVRVIELGARISLQPDAATWPGRLGAHVCSAGPADRLSWHGSLVSAVARGHRVAIAGVIGWRDNYYVRETTPSDPNIERELSEKLDDFDRMWDRLEAASKPRVWGLKLVS